MGTIVATSPGDIVVEFAVSGETDEAGSSASTVTYFEIPVKTLSLNKTIDVTPEYGIGSHQAYAHVVGKIAYDGDFTIGTWWVSAEDNPSTWDYLVRNYLTYQNDEGLPREFGIRVHARGGASMVRSGTGIYGVSDATAVTNDEVNLSSTASSVQDNMVIEAFQRCLLKGDGIDIPEVGGSVSRKYPFTCFRRDPK